MNIQQLRASIGTENSTFIENALVRFYRDGSVYIDELVPCIYTIMHRSCDESNEMFSRRVKTHIDDIPNEPEWSFQE